VQVAVVFFLFSVAVSVYTGRLIAKAGVDALALHAPPPRAPPPEVPPPEVHAPLESSAHPAVALDSPLEPADAAMFHGAVDRFPRRGSGTEDPVPEFEVDPPVAIGRSGREN
jgi:hypothetical protein